MFGQPKITPLPSDIDLSGKNAVITGASGDLGLETARQLLQLKCSTVILAMRNVSKGVTCARELREVPSIKANSPTIKVLQLDAERFDSIQAFTKTLKQEVPTVDIECSFERSPSGHEATVQVNYLSNVLLVELLTYLESSAEKSGSPTRVTWVGSRRNDAGESLSKKVPTGSVLEYMDSAETFAKFTRYGDSKLLCAMFVYSLAPRLDAGKIILNLVCPGMIGTNLESDLPQPLRFLVGILKRMRARTVEVGGWLILNAALIADEDSHGKHLGDKDILEKSRYLQSEAGLQAQKKLWDETMAEMKKLAPLPAKFN
ncbi:Short-chain dehydrogenase/reductase SDR [Penicillium maclennaniae]|uniref:Short-chain dehydrogenase/reductase SDR n=1 Tax=Penicillium maclennaniae TaxID=1343394 RepID=UPI0025407414|nr:Short-chain dehydrogenase/reductase SDR [Penicillium maclennaniae]KAJ5684330.1 Short-chain dehydrogenase/reductase SDR [Penicillium maclennaniae]